MGDLRLADGEVTRLVQAQRSHGRSGPPRRLGGDLRAAQLTALGEPGALDEAVGADVQEMITFFNIHGAMVYVDDKGQTTGYEDVFTKIEMCRKHYIEVDLHPDAILAISALGEPRVLRASTGGIVLPQ